MDTRPNTKWLTHLRVKLISYRNQSVDLKANKLTCVYMNRLLVLNRLMSAIKKCHIILNFPVSKVFEYRMFSEIHLFHSGKCQKI